MRLAIVFMILLCSISVSAQNLLVVRAAKDSLDGFMPFYDAHEKKVAFMLSMDSAVLRNNYSLSWAIQKKSSRNNTLDIYGQSIEYKKLTFDASIPINDTFINSGNYRIVFRLSTDSTIIQEKDFFFQTLRADNDYYKPAGSTNSSLISKKIVGTASNIDLSTTFAYKYNLSRIKANVQALSAIAEKSEQGALQTILKDDNLENLQRFFYNFWYTRNPQNPEAEWKAYAEKLNYVSRKYAYGTLKGYQTDKGQIYLRFGPPNRQVRASNENGTRPYEVWFYNELDKHTNLNILFAQINGIANERVLLHSSNPDFFFNPYWAQQLFTDPQEQFNKNSHRVYEFFK